MATRIRRILLAIGHLQRPSHALLRKTASIARACTASVELFHADPPLARWPDDVRTEKTRTADRERERQLLQRLAHSTLLKGVRVEPHVESDYPPHEAIVRRAIATRADLVVASVRVPSLAQRLWLRNTDWALIRQCPCPVLLVKSNRAYTRPAIVVAVDPFHAHAKPAALDQALLSAANSLAQALRGTTHVFHSYVPLVNLLPTPIGPVVPIAFPAEMEDAHARQVARVFDELASSAGVPAPRRHLHMGDVPSELNAVVKRTHAAIVVMGAVSRSGLRRAFIGNTAETALDAITCDVLVVKPRGFTSTVPRRRGTRG